MVANAFSSYGTHVENLALNTWRRHSVVTRTAKFNETVPLSRERLRGIQPGRQMEVVELSARLVYRRLQGGRCPRLKVNCPPPEVAACLLRAAALGTAWLVLITAQANRVLDLKLEKAIGRNINTAHRSLVRSMSGFDFAR